MRFPAPLLVLALIAPATGAPVIWDDGATLNGEPDTNFLADDNWNTDAVPGPNDDALLFSHGSPEPVRLPSTTAVKSIISEVPFDLDDTLTVSAPSSFENSIVSASNGRLRANGLVVFKGNNALQGVILDGSTGFANLGTVLLGSRGVTAPFENVGELILTSGNTRFTDLTNLGTFNLGGNGSINASSTVVNRGTLRKTAGANIIAQIAGSYTQQDGGLLEIAEGHRLNVVGATQRFNGGDIEVDGTLQLTQTEGGTPTHEFDGIGGIYGMGTVIQSRTFKVLETVQSSLGEAPGYQFMSGLEFGGGQSTAFQNFGYATITGSPGFEGGSPTGRQFYNFDDGTLEQAAGSNPTFRCTVANQGIWIASSMRCQTFLNFHEVVLRGDSKTIRPADAGAGDSFENLGTVRCSQELPFNRYTFTVPYKQSDQGTTRVDKGILYLDGGSGSFAGEFEVGTSDTLNIRLGAFTIKDGTLRLRGPGTAIIGATFGDPVIGYEPAAGDNGGVKFTSSLGLDVNDKIDNQKGLQFKSGSINVATSNLGYFDWRGGRLGAAFDNSNQLDVAVGSRPRTVGATLTNVASILQASSLNIAFPDGKIHNQGTHLLHPGASISGNVTDAYNNAGTFRVEGSTNTTVSAHFHNNGKVEVTGLSVLALTDPADVDPGGVLSGGEWFVDQGSLLILPNDITAIDQAVWTGSGTAKVSSLTGRGARLTKTESDTHDVPLTCSDGATLDCQSPCNLTVPACSLDSGAYYRGTGKVTCTSGDFSVGSGYVAPGNSAGTAGISGDTVFSTASTYEWEAAGTATADRLTVEDGTATLAGTVQPRLLDGYLPQPGQTFTILTAPAVAGTFDFVHHAYLPPGLTASLSYTPTAVTLTFNTAPVADYETWKQTRFSTAEQLDAEVSAPGADPDGDGLPNKAEYAFGLNPKAIDPSPVELVTSTTTTMDLCFPWAAGSHATYTVLTAPDPTGFTATTSTLQSTTPNIRPGVDLLLIRSTHPASPRQFSRLDIDLP